MVWVGGLGVHTNFMARFPKLLGAHFLMSHTAPKSWKLCTSSFKNPGHFNFRLILLHYAFFETLSQALRIGETHQSKDVLFSKKFP